MLRVVRSLSRSRCVVLSGLFTLLHAARRAMAAAPLLPILLLRAYPYPVSGGVSVIVELPYLLLPNTAEGLMESMRSLRLGESGWYWAGGQIIGYCGMGRGGVLVVARPFSTHAGIDAQAVDGWTACKYCFKPHICCLSTLSSWFAI